MLPRNPSYQEILEHEALQERREEVRERTLRFIPPMPVTRKEGTRKDGDQIQNAPQ